METASEQRSHRGADGYKRLYSRILKRVLGNGYKAYLEKLINDLIVEAQLSDEGRESYSTKDNLSKRYRLTARYREEVMAGGLPSYPITGWRLLQARDDSFSKSDKRVMDDHPWAELEMHAIQHLHFDEAAAAEWVQDCRERLDFRGELLTERKYASLNGVPYLLSTLQDLRKSGVKVGLCADLDRVTSAILIDRLGWNQDLMFDVVVTSDEGVTKPEIIMEALDQLNATDGFDGVMIGAVPTDVEAGRICGIKRRCLLNSSEWAVEADGVEVLYSLSRFPAWVSGPAARDGVGRLREV